MNTLDNHTTVTLIFAYLENLTATLYIFKGSMTLTLYVLLAFRGELFTDLWYVGISSNAMHDRGS